MCTRALQECTTPINIRATATTCVQECGHLQQSTKYISVDWNPLERFPTNSTTQPCSVGLFLLEQTHKYFGFVISHVSPCWGGMVGADRQREVLPADERVTQRHPCDLLRKTEVYVETCKGTTTLLLLQHSQHSLLQQLPFFCHNSKHRLEIQLVIQLLPLIFRNNSKLTLEHGMSPVNCLLCLSIVLIAYF